MAADLAKATPDVLNQRHETTCHYRGLKVPKVAASMDDLVQLHVMFIMRSLAAGRDGGPPYICFEKTVLGAQAPKQSIVPEGSIGQCTSARELFNDLAQKKEAKNPEQLTDLMTRHQRTLRELDDQFLEFEKALLNAMSGKAAVEFFGRAVEGKAAYSSEANHA